MLKAAARILLSLLFIAAGTAHLAVPEVFVPMVPPWLADPFQIVLITGIAELLGGLGLWLRATRRASGWGLIALLVGVFPANVYMAVEEIYPKGVPEEPWILWARLPLQAVLIIWAWWVSWEKLVRTRKSGLVRPVSAAVVAARRARAAAQPSGRARARRGAGSLDGRARVRLGSPATGGGVRAFIRRIRAVAGLTRGPETVSSVAVRRMRREDFRMVDKGPNPKADESVYFEFEPDQNAVFKDIAFLSRAAGAIAFLVGGLILAVVGFALMQKWQMAPESGPGGQIGMLGALSGGFMLGLGFLIGGFLSLNLGSSVAPLVGDRAKPLDQLVVALGALKGLYQVVMVMLLIAFGATVSFFGLLFVTNLMKA